MTTRGSSRVKADVRHEAVQMFLTSRSRVRDPSPSPNGPFIRHFYRFVAAVAFNFESLVRSCQIDATARD